MVFVSRVILGWMFVSLLSPHNDFPDFGCRSDVVYCTLMDTLVVIVVDDIAVCYD